MIPDGDFLRAGGMRIWGMRTGVTLSISQTDLDRLRSLVKDRNAPQKHEWRAQIVLLSAEGVGTNAIMRETGKTKTCVWRWQERIAAEGVEGLLRDKTRPSRIAKLTPSVAERVVELTMEPPPARRPIGQSALMQCHRRQRLLHPAHLARAWAPTAPRAAVQAFERS